MKNNDQSIPCETARQWIVENAQRGAPFRIRFREDPQLYQGIPVALPGMTPDADEQFEFKITEPYELRGLTLRAYCDIEYMERCV